jgi:hypothetical protein
MSKAASRFMVVGLTTLLATGWMAASPPATRAAGSVSLTTIGTAYSQSFNALATLGTVNALDSAPGLGGWELTESGGSFRDNELYGATTGSDTNGDSYSFGTTSALLDRALGGLRGTTLVPSFGATFTNATGATIGKLDIAYTGEMYRAGVLNRNAADRIDFQLSLDATSLTTGTWTSYDALDFSSPNINTTVGAKDGNASAFRTVLASQITGLAIANGSSFWIRWTDFDITGADDGLAVDDFSITPGVDDVAPQVLATTPGDGDEDVAVDADVSVTFSEPVNVSDTAFDVTCTSSGARDLIVSGGPTTFTLDPTGNFRQHEYCTVTVDDAGVTDADASDPPDHLAADVNLTFRVANPAPIFTIVKGASCSTTATGGTFLVNVSDLEMSADDLTLELSSEPGTALVPNANVWISGGADRAIEIAVASRQIGSSVLSFNLSDGVNDVTFDITVQVGTDADDTLTGTDGSDLIAGSQGDDSISGLGGADVLCGSNGNDTVLGGDGNDFVSGDKGGDTLAGDGGEDSLVGGHGGDNLTGGEDADAFSGGLGGDTNADFDEDEGDTSDGT